MMKSAPDESAPGYVLLAQPLTGISVALLLAATALTITCTRLAVQQSKGLAAAGVI
jgi:hypothetical protein